MGFDPDKYLKKKFNPDLYLSGKDAPQDSAEMQDTSLMGSVGRFGQSALELGKGAVDALAHPVNTAEGIGGILLNVLKASSPDPQWQAEGRAGLAPIGETYAQRYGGWENIKKTFGEDPVGFMADLSTLVGGAGAAMKTAKTGSVMAKTGNVVSKTAGFIDPVALPANLGRGGIALTGLPEKQYAKALSIPSSVKSADRAALVATGLSEGVTLSKGGYGKLLGSIDNLNQQISEMVNTAHIAGKRVDTAPILEALEDVKRWWGDDMAPGSAVKQLDELGKEFSDLRGKSISVGQAQKMKQRTYQILRNEYSKGEFTTSTPVKEGKIAMARAIKDELVKQQPELSALNAHDSRLLNLEPFVDKAVAKTERHVFGGISTLGLATGDPTRAGVLIAVRELLNNPNIRSRIALVLDRSRKKLGNQSKVVKPLGQIQRQPEEE